MEIIKLNIIPSGVNPTCHASQYDEGRAIRIELYEGLSPFTLQASDEVSLAIRKPDDKIVTMIVTNTEDNYVDIFTTRQACAVVGSNLCELTIKRSSVVIGTLNFYMQVERDPLSGGDPSESEIRDLQERVNACVEVALEDLYDGTSVLFDTEPVLDHDAPYTVSSDGIARAFGAVNTALSGKVDSSTLANYYNKTEVDTALNGKADTTDLADYYTKLETYSATEINNLFSGLDLDDLHDVVIDSATLAGGQGLVYDALTGEWKNGEVSTTSTLEDLTDTTITNKQDGDGLLYNSTLAKWINQAICKEISQADYDLLSQAEKENGTAYYCPDAPSASVDASDVEYSSGVSVYDKINNLTLGELSDVNTSGASTGNILVKGANGWESVENSFSNLTNKPQYKDYKNITLNSNSSVSPFNYYIELDISDLSAHTVVALTLWGQSSYFPTTTTVGTQGDVFTSVRIYGYKNSTAPVTTNLRVYYI